MHHIHYIYMYIPTLTFLEYTLLIQFVKYCYTYIILVIDCSFLYVSHIYDTATQTASVGMYSVCDTLSQR